MKPLYPTLALLSTFAIALSVSTGATAGNEGPYGRPNYPGGGSPVLAAVRSEGPMVAPQYRVRHTVEIHADGSIDRTEQRGSGPVNHETLATLTPETTRRLETQINTMPPADLEAIDTRTMPCPGAGLIEYTVRQSGIVTMPIARDMGCGNFLRRVDGKGNNIVALLSAFLSYSTQSLPGGELYGIEGDVIAHYTMRAGFVGPKGARLSQVQLLEDGRLIQNLAFADGRKEQNHILTLTSRVIKELELLGQLVPDQKIVEPNRPRCMDAPSYEIQVHRGSPDGGKLVTTWRKFGCVESALPATGAVPFFNSFIKHLYQGSLEERK